MNDAIKPPSALRDPLFRGLWLASLGSGIGATMQETAAIWTLTTTTDKAWMVTLFQSLLSLPLFFFALPAGALADLVDKRRLMAGIQICGAVLAAGVSLLSWLGLLPPSMLLLSAFVLGTVSAFGNPTWSALMPEVISRPMMASAITLGSVGINLARAIGPFVGGWLVANTGPTPAFVVNAVSYLGLAFMLLRWHRPAPEFRPHAESVAGAMIAAVRHVRYSPSIQRVLLRHGLFTFSAFAPVALLPLRVKELGLAGSSYGSLMGIYGLGGILTAIFILPHARRRFTVDQIVTAAATVSFAVTLLFPIAGSFGVLALLLFPAGAAWLATMAQMNFAGQSLFPHWVRARASAVHLLTVQGSLALGSLLWGGLTARYGITTALFVAATGVAVYGVVSFRYRLDRSLARELDPADSGHFHDHLPRVPADEQGPLRVSLTYQIHPDDVPQFSRAMGELRESRLRDGACRWHLWRSLENPLVYHEVFLLGSWGEHLRQDQRATRESVLIEQRAKSFHHGPEPILVEHALHLEPSRSAL